MKPLALQLEERVPALPLSVHLFLADLDRSDDETALAKTLSADERERASRFTHEMHRRRYTVGRANLRQLLAQCLDVDPASIEFEYGPHGKPFVKTRVGGPLHFNVSHSDSVALYALSFEREVGCDIERLRPLEELPSIVSRWFAPAECERILGGDPAERETQFFRYWTLKEAVLKGLGTGLTLLSHDFEVRATSRGDFRAHGSDDLQRWTAMPCAAPEGFAAAVAMFDETGNTENVLDS